MTERPGDAPKVPCPQCGGFRSRVKEGRSTEDGYRRNRICRDCRTRFVTLETFERPTRKYQRIEPNHNI